MKWISSVVFLAMLAALYVAWSKQAPVSENRPVARKLAEGKSRSIRMQQTEIPRSKEESSSAEPNWQSSNDKPTLSKAPVTASLLEVNPVGRDTSGIPHYFLEAGAAFEGDLLSLFRLEEGDPLFLDLGPVHFTVQGQIGRKTISEGGQRSIRIDFPEDSENSQVNLHFDKEGRMEAKLYSRAGNFHLVHNGQIGFILSFEEMNRLEQLELEK